MQRTNIYSPTMRRWKLAPSINVLYPSGPFSQTQCPYAMCTESIERFVKYLWFFFLPGSSAPKASVHIWYGSPKVHRESGRNTAEESRSDRIITVRSAADRVVAEDNVNVL